MNVAAVRRPAARVEAATAIVALLAAIPVVVFFAFPTFPQYDSYFHLVWGRGLLHGVSPDFEAYAAPTEHPLYVGIGALLSLLGTSGGERAMVLLTLLSLSALTVAVHAEVPLVTLRSMMYAYPTFHRAIEAALADLG